MKKIQLILILIFITSCNSKEIQKPKTTNHKPNEKAKKLYFEAQKNFINNNFNKALELFGESFENDNNYISPLKGLFQVYLSKNELKKADSIIDLVILKEPEIYTYHMQKGLVNELMNNSNHQKFYDKGKAIFNTYRKYYENKYSELDFVFMLKDIDSIEARSKIKKIIRNGNNSFSEELIIDLFQKTHGEVIKEIKERFKETLAPRNNNNNLIENETSGDIIDIIE